MADKLITGVVYGNHPPPKKKRPLKDRLKLPVTIGLVVVILGVAVYKYINYREEGRVREFMARIQSGSYDEAYASWGGSATYRMKDFLEDWGPSGYYTTGLKAARIVTSHRVGTAVNVRVFIDPYSNGPNSKPIELRVDKESQKMSFAP